jgi:apolipoprotein D and lipocalin family protein
MGRWYAVAHIPTSFERHCATGITATYTLLENGQIEVINGCCQEDGSLQQARGRAWIPDPANPGKLKVSFVRFLGWWLFPGDYWILALGEAYEYAVVGHPELTYGWILSRTPTLPAASLREAIEKLEAQGYSFDAFELMPPGGCQQPREPR